MPYRLKSLELNGYKTFANRTLFEFANTITSIIGPNGSGKSNIADSIRWVLGEQSYRLLRGKKTEDMIFSGSESRARAGMASATITFDNSDGWLPIEFEEVSVARRAYRDGQNEYLINGQRVRLKDVSELLSQSGLAERTYTIIGQGLVDAALSLRPDERRRLFEEAAGISLHRVRREEAIRRLENTRRNLERVQDILSEIKPRLRSLERQAKRARDHEQIKQELHQLLREWYGYHWYLSQNNLDNSIDSLNKLDSQVNHDLEIHNELQQRTRNLNRSIQQERLKMVELRNKLETENRKREIASRELAVNKERKTAFGRQDLSLQIEINEIEQQTSEIREFLISSSKENEGILSKLTDARGHYDTARKALADRLEQQSVFERKVSKTKLENETLIRQESTLRANLENVNDTLSAKESDLVEQKEKETELKTLLENSRDSIQKSEDLSDSVKNEILGLEGQIVDVDENLSKTSQELLEQQENLRRLTLEISELTARNNIYETAERTFEGYSEGSRLLAESGQKNQRYKSSGLLGSNIVVEKGYELAANAAFGTLLESVLIKANPDHALDILKEKSLSGVILDIQGSSSEEDADKKSPVSIRGVEDNLIKYVSSNDKNLTPVLKKLLSKTNLASSRSSAREFVQSNPGFTAVTLEGEVFNDDGSIIALYGKRDPERNVLNRKEVIDNFQKRISELETQKSSLIETIAANQVEISKFQDEKNQLENSLHQSESQLVKNESALQMLKAEFQSKSAEIKNIKQKTIEVNESIQLITDQITQFEAELEQFPKNNPEYDTEDFESKRELSSISELQESFSKWNDAVASLERNSNERRILENERKDLLRNLEFSLSQKQEQLKRIRDDNQELEQKNISLEIELEQLQSRVSETTNSITNQEEEISRLTNEEEELSHKTSRSQKRMTELERVQAQAQLTVMRNREVIETMRLKIEDDFGLVDFDYSEKVSGPVPLPFDGIVENLIPSEEISSELEDEIQSRRIQIRRMGSINSEAMQEFDEVSTRYEFLTNQIEDLHTAENDVRKVIEELDLLMHEEFCKTFDAVAAEFKIIFNRLFGGGTASLILINPDDITNSGIDIDARLPGRRTQGLSLLSGGERSLTATALVLALINVSPPPFCLLDEVDAMLDEANTRRLRELLEEMSEESQFVIVTHNRNTVESADIIYGVTMGRDSASQVLSLKIDEVKEVVD